MHTQRLHKLHLTNQRRTASISTRSPLRNASSSACIRDSFLMRWHTLNQINGERVWGPIVHSCTHTSSHHMHTQKRTGTWRPQRRRRLSPQAPACPSRSAPCSACLPVVWGCVGRCMGLAIECPLLVPFGRVCLKRQLHHPHKRSTTMPCHQHNLTIDPPTSHHRQGLLQPAT